MYRRMTLKVKPVLSIVHVVQRYHIYTRDIFIYRYYIDVLVLVPGAWKGYDSLLIAEAETYTCGDALDPS